MTNTELSTAEEFIVEDDWMIDATVRARTRELYKKMKEKTTATTYKRTRAGKTEHYTEQPDIPVASLQANIQNGEGQVVWEELAHDADGQRLAQVNVAPNNDPNDERDVHVVSMDYPVIRRVEVKIRDGEPLEFNTRSYEDEIDQDRLVNRRDEFDPHDYLPDRYKTTTGDDEDDGE